MVVMGQMPSEILLPSQLPCLTLFRQTSSNSNFTRPHHAIEDCDAALGKISGICVRRKYVLMMVMGQMSREILLPSQLTFLTPFRQTSNSNFTRLHHAIEDCDAALGKIVGIRVSGVRCPCLHPVKKSLSPRQIRKRLASCCFPSPIKNLVYDADSHLTRRFPSNRIGHSLSV